MRALTVRLQRLDGTWDVVGAVAARGIVPENTELSADKWGPLKATFDLHRSPSVSWPDLTAWTPVEIEVDGVSVWDGRVLETPTREGDDSVISVQCEGWQFHLDDDPFERIYVHTRLSDYRDCRSTLTEDLTIHTTGGHVETGASAMSLGFAKNYNPGSSTRRAGVVLDLGPERASWARRVVVEWEGTANETAVNFKIQLCDEAKTTSPSGSDGTTVANLGSAGGTTGLTATAPRRYVQFFVESSHSAALTSDHAAKIKRVLVVSDTAYESGDASILRADQVFIDAIARGTLLLSSDLSGIEQADFEIPDFAPREGRSPREFITAVNAYHDWRAQIQIGRRPVFAPKPTVPTVEIGAWGGSEFRNASANSGAEIYNGVVVEASSPDEAPIRVMRRAGSTTVEDAERLTTPSLPNPSFTTNAAGYILSGGTLVRDTSTFDSTPASGRWDTEDHGQQRLSTSFTGTFLAGVTWLVRIVLKRAAASTAELTLELGAGDDVAQQAISVGASFGAYLVAWSPEASTTAGELRLVERGQVLDDVNTYWIDSIDLYKVAATLVDRRNFRRTKRLQVQAAVTETGAEKIADVWLAAHRTTPLKGDVSITGEHGARNPQTGERIPPPHLLLHGGNVLRMSDRIDPDTGAIGRDARIDAVHWKHVDDTAEITLDNSRANVEALLERLAVVVGAGR